MNFRIPKEKHLKWFFWTNHATAPNKDLTLANLQVLCLKESLKTASSEEN